MGLFFKIFILTLVTVNSTENLKNILPPVISRENNNMADCLLYIVSNVNLPALPKIQISIKTQHTNITEKFMENVEIFRRNYKNIILDLLSDGNGGFDINLMFFFIDSLKSLEYLVERNQQNKVELLSIDNSALYIIILPATLESSDELLKQIFDLCLKQSILNVLVLQENEAGTIFLYTYYPYTEKNCRNTIPRLQNTFSNGSFQLQKPLFEQKTKNLQLCPVRIIVIEHSEFINPMEPAIFDDALLKILAAEMNFSIEYKMSPEGRGVVYSNDNMTNDLKMLHDGDGDLIIGTWCNTMASQVFGAVPYTFDKELIVFKNPEKYSYLDILFFPFDATTWTMILFSYISHLTVRFATKKFGLRSKDSMRFYIITWLLGMMILSSSYGGSLFKFIHDSPSKPIPKNVEGAIKEDYTFLVSSEGLYDDLKVLQNHTFGVGEDDMYAAFKEVSGKFAWIISDKYLNSYEDKGLKYFVAYEPLYTSLQCIYTRKNSYLSLTVRKQIELMKSYGLLNFINRMTQTKNILKENENKKLKPMSLFQVKGAFVLYLIFNGVSLIIFGMEHEISRIQNIYRMNI
ncbi:uncharacterized protein LOC129905387 [Episyrphus balteatus]|uniref:uncharacterized protein LOC129905387 n=1 Tax=Episyrphus balteatus TaxID=286459 RepID=UPI00248678FA|nr:uncharacterized protein LOC129905387 [Episyrphus balteatus]